MATTPQPIPQKVLVTDESGYVSQPWLKWLLFLANQRVLNGIETNLINSKYAASSATTEYTVPASTTTTIDSFTVTNSTGGAVNITVYLVPSGGSAGPSNVIVSAQAISAGATTVLSSLANQTLSTGDFISVFASAATSLTIRASGREATT